MLSQRKRVSILESLFRHSARGQTLGRSSTSEAREELDSTTSTRSQTNPLPRSPISTVESLVPSKDQTLNDKLLRSSCHILTLRSSRISQVESTLTGKDYKKYLMKHFRETSNKLWLPTRTGFVGLRGNISHGCSLNSTLISSSIMERNVLLPTNSRTISSPSYTYSLVDTMEVGGQSLLNQFKKNRKKKISHLERMRSARENVKNFTELDETKCVPSVRRVEIVVGKKTSKTINDWFASYRKVWNKTLHYLKSNGITKTDNKELQNRFVVRKNMDPETVREMEWTFRTPKRIREYAVIDLHSSYEACNTQVKKKRIKQFCIRPKEKNSQMETICLPKESSHLYGNHIRVAGIDLQFRKSIKLDCKEGLSVSHNMRFQKIGSSYFLFLPHFTEPPENLKRSKENIIAVDPGVNIFASFYSPNGEYGFVGSEYKDFIDRKLKEIAKIREHVVENKHRAIQKRKMEIYNKISDFQWKLCHYLLSNYNKIIIPRLYVPRTRTATKIHQQYLKHCRFVDRLSYKSMFYENSTVFECREKHTSQLCTRCGSSKTVKGGVVSCKDCGRTIHRDLAGARNIFMRSIKMSK